MISQLSAITFNDIVNARTLYKVIMLMLLSFLIGSIGFWFLLKNPIQDFFSSQEKYQQSKQQIFRDKNELQKLPMYKAKLAAMRKLFMTPDRANNIVKKIYTISKDSEVEFLSVKNSKPSQEGLYNVFSGTFVVIGKYQQLVEFMHKLLHLNILVEIGNFSLLSANNRVGQQAMMKTLLALTLKVKIYGASIKSVNIRYKIPLVRDPFQRIATIKQQNNLWVNFSLKQLRMVGSIYEDKRIWALILSPAGEVVRVQLDDVIGENNGMIVNINNDSIKVLEETEINGIKEKNWEILHLVKDAK